MRFILLLVLLICFSCSKNSDRIVYLAAADEDCAGKEGEVCLKMKEEGALMWKPFPNPIEGFEFKEGFYYKIKVGVNEISESANGISQNYKLIEILEQSTGPIVLDSGAWLVTRINDMNGFARNPFMRINVSQQLISGNTGCNRFSAKLKIEGQSITISKLTATEMSCREMPVERGFMEALKESTNYKLADGKLQLFDDQKTLLLEADFLKSE